MQFQIEYFKRTNCTKHIFSFINIFWKYRGNRLLRHRGKSLFFVSTKVYISLTLSFLSLFYVSFSLSLSPSTLTILFPRCFSLLILLCFAVSLPVSFDLLLLYLLLSLLLFCCFILQPRKSLPRCKM